MASNDDSQEQRVADEAGEAPEGGPVAASETAGRNGHLDDSELDAETDEDQDAIEQMEELVEYVARQLVDDRDAVEVHSVPGDRATVFELTVAEGDLGKVIGRDGRTARALRTLLAASGAKLRRRAVLDILE